MTTDPFVPRRVGVLGLFLLAVLCASARERRTLDFGWRFNHGDAPGAEAPAFDDGGWRTVDLPHDWSIEGGVAADAPSTGQGGFFPTGVGWYRHTFTAPQAWAGQCVWVEFEGVYMNAGVWLNGQRLGVQPYGYTSFVFDLTPHLQISGPNVLAVRVDNSRQPNSRWYSGSGLYRHVWLHEAAPVHVAPWGVFVATTEASAAAATVRVQTAVRNASATRVFATVATRILAPDGQVVAVGSTVAAVRLEPRAEQTVTYTVTLPAPRWWSPETPSLYRADTRVTVGNHAVDETQTIFGVRTVKVSAERGFEFNGRAIKLAGGNVHHDNGPLGTAAFDRAEERRVELLKAAGFNAIRTAHNPPSPAFLAACDRLGLLVMDEAFDCWERGKNSGDYGRFFQDWWRHDLDTMIRRDRNHPAVVLWSIGNEVYERASPGGGRIAQMLADRIRELDDTRPVTAGVNGPGKSAAWSVLDRLFATLDVAGYNYELDRHADDHARLPGRVIVSTESYQQTTFRYWSLVHDQPYVIGDFVWSALDYLGEAGIGRVFPPGEKVVAHWEAGQFPWHGAYCGDLDLTGWRKPVSHYRNIVWDRGEKLYAAVLVPSVDGRPWNPSKWAMPPALPSWTWPGQEGKTLQVDVYSRHDSVRLYLNGQRLGEQPTTQAQEFKAAFAVPYAPGILKAVGVCAGREVEEFTLTTAGPPARLRVTPDRTTIAADGQDLVFVTVEVTDAEGRLRPDADRAVEIGVDGPGAIAGICNGDLTTMESYRANPHRVFQGRAVVIVRSTPAAGAITLTARTAGLAEAKVAIQTHR